VPKRHNSFALKICRTSSGAACHIAESDINPLADDEQEEDMEETEEEEEEEMA